MTPPSEQLKTILFENELAEQLDLPTAMHHEITYKETAEVSKHVLLEYALSCSALSAAQPRLKPKSRGCMRSWTDIAS